jgi:hypothetical protein
MVPWNSKRPPMKAAVHAGFHAIEPVASRQMPVSAPPIASFTGPAPCRKRPSAAFAVFGQNSIRIVNARTLKSAADILLRLIFVPSHLRAVHCRAENLSC